MNLNCRSRAITSYQVRNKANLYKEEILKTLSYFEPMTLEKLFLDFDESFLLNYPELTVEELAKNLQELQKSKLIKTVEDGGQKAWLRVFSKKRFGRFSRWWKKFVKFCRSQN